MNPEQKSKVEIVEQKIRRVNDFFIRAQARFDQNKKSRDKAIERHTLLMDEYKIQAEAIMLLKQLIGIISATGISQIENLVTYGLNTIFYDKEQKFIIKVDDRGQKKTAEFYISQWIAPGEELVAPIRDSKGGGIKSVVSFILRVFFIQKSKLRPVIFLDEELTEVSNKYRQYVFNFLKVLSQELKFDFLFITHDEDIVEIADSVYKVTMGRVRKIK